MKVLKSGEKLIVKETVAWWWFHKGVSDPLYDIYLVEDSSKNLILVIFMKIQFIFEKSKKMPWSLFDKNVFVKRFEHVINEKWGNKRLLKSLYKGKKVYLDFRFESTISWSISEHWEVHVKKATKKFEISSVIRRKRRVNLDSNDFTPKKFRNQKETQRGIVHEFGHMLGLRDEYKVGSLYVKDVLSIMNHGESIRDRHDYVFIKWLDKILAEKE